MRLSWAILTGLLSWWIESREVFSHGVSPLLALGISIMYASGVALVMVIIYQCMVQGEK